MSKEHYNDTDSMLASVLYISAEALSASIRLSLSATTLLNDKRIVFLIRHHGLLMLLLSDRQQRSYTDPTAMPRAHHREKIV